jgi:hypothetical protein
MTTNFGHYVGVTIPKWLRIDLTATEAAIVGAALVACVSALLELWRWFL